jgi:hypothetical protein
LEAPLTEKSAFTAFNLNHNEIERTYRAKYFHGEKYASDVKSAAQLIHTSVLTSRMPLGARNVSRDMRVNFGKIGLQKGSQG